MANEIVRAMSGLLERKEAFLDRALAGALPVERFIQAAMQVYVASDKLIACEQKSVYTAMAACAQLGLSLHVQLGQAYLVPFSGKCTLIIGYKGFVKLLWQSPRVASLHGGIIYSEEEWEETSGSVSRLRHTIIRDHAKRGEDIVAAYAVITTDLGGTMHCLMGRDDIMACVPYHQKDKNTGEVYPSSQWHENQNLPAMIKKTPWRHIAKLAPISEMASQAVSVDEGGDRGVTYKEYDDGSVGPDEPKKIDSTVVPEDFGESDAPENPSGEEGAK